ncbi:MAG: hypothetical protein R2874_13345 [Desulfobacterales bacterium]
MDRLCRLVSDFKSKYGKVVYLEPGEAVALNAGYLVGSVLDVFTMKWISRFWTHPPPHMPDVLEMPAWARISSAQGSPVKKPPTAWPACPALAKGHYRGLFI